jgi:hypothetical protein
MKKIIPSSLQDMKTAVFTALFIVAAFFLVLGADGASAQGSTDPVQSGSVGLTGQISAPPPAQGATISFPTNGQNFTDLPVIITGICPDGLLVKIFKNNVFGGSVQCVGGNFSLQSDLFVGTNDLVARVFDDLDQPGPDSNIVTVNFAGNNINTPSRVTLTSNFAKRGANPGQTLTWPVILSGGQGPFAFSVDWGDDKEPDLFTVPFAGTIDLSHVYDEPGVFNIIVKVVDTNGTTAFLQLVGIGNGPLSQTTDTTNDEEGIGLTSTRTRVVWWPAAVIVPFAVSTFWLGKRYMLKVMKKRIERGEHPFADF